MNSTIVESWATERLGNIVDIKTGKLDSNFAEEKGKYPFFTCAPNPLRINHFAFDCEAILLAGNNADGIFHLNFYNGKFNAYQRTYVITTKDENGLDLHYLYYYLQLSLNVLKDFSQGTSTKFLTMRILKELEINLPSFEEQKKIAKILADLDSKIELNERMNRSLEAVGAALFRRWFVDFEFPNEEGKPYRSTGGKMVESELGEIPEGWMVGILGDIADKISISVSSEEKFSYDKYVSLDDMPKEQIFLNRFSSVDDVDSSMISFEEGDILFGAMRPYFHKVCIAPFSGITRTTTFVIRAKNKAYQSFLTFLCFQKSTVDYADSTSVGSTIPYAVFDALEKMPIIIPRNEVALKFQQFIKPFIDKAHANFRETLILSQIRDLLLPKLISGKIRVPLKKEN